MNTTHSGPLSALNYRLWLTLSILIFLTLLINVSFKLIIIQGVVFSASALLCALIAIFYFLAILNTTAWEQRQLLYHAFLALYLFSVGIYLLVNLPPTDYIDNQIAYQIVFEDIPNKFFSATLAFALSFYLPHLYFITKEKTILSPKGSLLLALWSGLSFFSIDFWLLFSGAAFSNMAPVYLNSLALTVGCFLIFAGVYCAVRLLGSYCRVFQQGVDVLVNLVNAFKKIGISKTIRQEELFQGYALFYPYFVSFSVIIVLISLACEYRLVTLGNEWILAASSILSPLALLAANMIGLLYGYRASIHLLIVLVLSEWVFDLCLMCIVALPSPPFFNINSFYSFIMPQRIPAATFALIVAFGINALLIEKLRTFFHLRTWLTCLIANVFANSLLCLVNYSILFAGIYSYDQIVSLTIDAWVYKLLITVLGIPCVIWGLRKIKKYPTFCARIFSESR